MENNEDKLLRNNPFFIISLCCLAAMTMTTASILAYMRSDTRKTIEQIQQNNRTTTSVQQASVTGPVTSTTLSTMQKDITDKINTMDNDTDFDPDKLTDSALGL